MAEVLLLQERGRSSEEIASALEVSKRTVIRDIQALCEMGVPIFSRDGAGGGYSLAANYTIEPLELNWREAFLLIMSVDALAKLSDTPFSAERVSLVAKLRALIPSKHLDRLESMRETVTLQVPEHTPQAPMLDRLVEVVGTGTWFSMRYDSADGITERLIRPDKVYADRGLWYLTGADADGFRMLRVDRILELEPADPPETVTEELPYDHPSHPIVRVRLTRRGARMVQRDPHMGGDVDASLELQTLEFRCPESELDWYAKYFGNMGSDALVEGPEELRERIREKSLRLLELYGADVSKWSRVLDSVVSPLKAGN